MKNFKFNVTQQLVGYYKGTINIETKSLKDAKKQLSRMKNKTIEVLVENWTHGDDYYPVGPVDVDINSGKEV